MSRELHPHPYRTALQRFAVATIAYHHGANGERFAEQEAAAHAVVELITQQSVAAWRERDAITNCIVADCADKHDHWPYGVPRLA